MTRYHILLVIIAICNVNAEESYAASSKRKSIVEINKDLLDNDYTIDNKEYNSVVSGYNILLRCGQLRGMVTTPVSMTKQSSLDERMDSSLDDTIYSIYSLDERMDSSLDDTVYSIYSNMLDSTDNEEMLVKKFAFYCAKNCLPCVKIYQEMLRKTRSCREKLASIKILTFYKKEVTLQELPYMFCNHGFREVRAIGELYLRNLDKARLSHDVKTHHWGTNLYVDSILIRAMGAKGGREYIPIILYRMRKSQTIYVYSAALESLGLLGYRKAIEKVDQVIGCKIDDAKANSKYFKMAQDWYYYHEYTTKCHVGISVNLGWYYPLARERIKAIKRLKYFTGSEENRIAVKVKRKNRQGDYYVVECIIDNRTCEYLDAGNMMNCEVTDENKKKIGDCVNDYIYYGHPFIEPYEMQEVIYKYKASDAGRSEGIGLRIGGVTMVEFE